MKISFVIPAHNEAEYIGACVKSILANWTPDFLEIIVVDNASKDATAAKASGFPHVKVVREPRRGTNWARQRGLMEARGDFVAYLDADTQMPTLWATTVKKEFHENPSLVCLSGPFHYYDLPPSKKFIAETLWKLFVPLGYRILGFAILGANFVAKRAALLQIGGFDTSIVFHGDDSDTARRLSKVGKVKFDMDFFILGSGRRLMQEGIIKMFWMYGLNYLWGAFKHRPYTKGYQDPRQ